MMSTEAQLANLRWHAEKAAKDNLQRNMDTLRVVRGLVSILAETMTTETMITSCVLRANADPRLTKEMINAVKR
jgi:hypothetical protein